MSNVKDYFSARWDDYCSCIIVTDEIEDAVELFKNSILIDNNYFSFSGNIHVKYIEFYEKYNCYMVEFSDNDYSCRIDFFKMKTTTHSNVFVS